MRRRAHRHLVHHTASGTDALQRIGTVDHLDPVDEEGIDCIAIARSVAHRRGLGDAVDRIERRASAQAFARATELFARGREGGQQGRNRIHRGAGNLHLPLERFGIDHIDGQRQSADRQLRARGRNDDRRIFALRIGVCVSIGLGQCRRRKDERDCGGGVTKRHEPS